MVYNLVLPVQFGKLNNSFPSKEFRHQLYLLPFTESKRITQICY